MSINMPQQNRASNYDKKAIEVSKLCLNVRFYDIKRQQSPEKKSIECINACIPS
jgi:hypothetical protein